jgi:ribosomal protein L7/L12
LTETARQLLASGADADQVAKELLRRADSPTSAIKAIVDATGLGLGDAKWVVHRNLSLDVREAAERLWDDLLDGLRQFQEPPSEPDQTR